MDKQSFEHEMGRAQAMRTAGDRPEYWAGYMRGLRRKYHGEDFGTDEEHRLWLTADGDTLRRERSAGYRAGYIPEYCTQNEGDCQTCSLVNYGRDCRNEPLERNGS